MKAHKVDCVCGQCGVAYRKRADRVKSPDFCRNSCRSAFAAEKKMRICDQCGVEFQAHNWAIKCSGGKYCSPACSSIGQTGSVRSEESRRRMSEAQKGKYVPSGPSNPCYKGRGVSAGYVWVRDGSGPPIAEHRLVAEQTLGRKLLSSEIVHHINRDKTDNRWENLEIMTRGEHLKEHYPQIEAARPEPLKGEDNPGAKLTEPDVRRIRSSTDPGTWLAREFGVSSTLVGMVRKRKIWKHVA